jgi:hypothetical protein
MQGDFEDFLGEKSVSYEAGSVVLVKQNVLWLPFTKQEASKKYRVSTNDFLIPSFILNQSHRMNA